MTREEAKREIIFAKREVMADSWIDKAYDMAIKAMAQPEIVRCKDCKHYKLSNLPSMGMPIRICEKWKQEDIDDDDFCSRAERREG